MLEVLPKISSPSRECLVALMEFSIDLGPARMQELIQTSPAAGFLLPLTTALERELGIETRVAREVEEVARDVRRNLAKLREDRAFGIESVRDNRKAASGGN